MRFKIHPPTTTDKLELNNYPLLCSIYSKTAKKWVKWSRLKPSAAAHYGKRGKRGKVLLEAPHGI